MFSTPDEATPATVRFGAMQAGETRSRQWAWVERSVWTDRMLEALDKGVKGDVWFSLIDKVMRPATLFAAWKQVRANKGAAGADRVSIAEFERDLEENLARLHGEVAGGTYGPRPIRRVYIDKPGGKVKRPLGIPAVRDRVVQAALRLVIEPIFEREFVPASYGFRPQRGCKDALREVDRLLKSGYRHVVDADIASYFDSIPHEGLMAEVRKRIADGRVLALIEAFLSQDVMEGMARWTPEAGTPQGAVISPLLANVYMHSVDVAMAEAGLRMVRYADDFVVLCKSRQEAEEALEKVRRLTSAKGLTLHPEKTCLVNMDKEGEGFEFLGYRFERGTRKPRKKSLGKLKDTVRRKTGSSNGRSMDAIVTDVNATLAGWFGYFRHSNKWTFPPLDGWIRRRLRSILRRREKRKGMSRGWDNRAWPNKFFRELGLFSLEDAHASLLRSS